MHIRQSQDYEVLTEFEKEMACLDDLIIRCYKYNVLPLIKKVYHDYKEKTTVNASASKIINDLLSEGVRFCLSNISKVYRKRILKQYYSTDGLVFYITTNLQQLVDNDLYELVNGEIERK